MKKLLALMLCLTLVLSFTGCSLGGTKGTFSNLVAMSEIEEGGLSTHLTVKYDNENIMDSYTKFACIIPCRRGKVNIKLENESGESWPPADCIVIIKRIAVERIVPRARLKDISIGKAELSKL